MKKIHVLLAVFLLQSIVSVAYCQSQNIGFTYDPKGNMITQKVINLPKNALPPQNSNNDNFDFSGNSDPHTCFTENINDVRVSVFPNPVKQMLNIVTEPANDASLFFIYLFTTNGEVLNTFEIEPGKQKLIDLQSVEPGVYYLVLQYGSGKSQWKIVKE